MSSARLLALDNNDNMSSSETGVIVKDIIPRSMSDGDDVCLCTCSCCPTLFDWCLKDSFGLSCGIITWCLFFYAEFFIIFVILIPKNFSSLFNISNLIIFHILEFLAISSHCRTMFSNPGAIPLNNATRENLLRYENGTIVYRCAMCQSIKPPRAHHCSVCKRCIKRMDHHCVFVNNCIGQNNQKYFILFTFYTCIISLYALILVYFHITTCIKSNWTACPTWSPPITLIFVIFLALEGVSFSLFTGIMLSTQLYALYIDRTGIEYFQGKSSINHEKTTFISSLKIVFGSRIGLSWLNPFSKPIYLITQNDERITFDV